VVIGGTSMKGGEGSLLHGDRRTDHRRHLKRIEPSGVPQAGSGVKGLIIIVAVIIDVFRRRSSETA
jgi:ribose/xylose/arabinose/galactoside ABC-type transport system permease subunit